MTCNVAIAKLLTMQTELTDSQIIDALGGNQEVARLCSPTLPAVVSGWRNRGIPLAWKKYLQQINPEAFEVKKAVA